MNDDLLSALIDRGDEVAINRGRLNVIPNSGKKVPKEWLKANYWTLTAQILRCTGRRGYRFDRFTRSSGGYGGGKFPGITLHYTEVLTEEETHLIFNAEVTKPGSSELRPGKRFLPPERGSFIKYWKRTVGDLPQGRRSKCWESMSRFKPIVIDLAPDYRGKGCNKTAVTVELRHDQICASIADPMRTGNAPSSNQIRTTIPPEGIARELADTGLQRFQTTCAANYELSKQDSAITRNESTEEWLRRYDS